MFIIGCEIQSAVPASTQKYPIYAKYPPTTGIGKRLTASASLNLPIRTNTNPSKAVPEQSNANAVDNISDSVCPSSIIVLAIVFAISDRKIKPASWTQPIAKGREENNKKPNWCTIDENISTIRIK